MSRKRGRLRSPVCKQEYGRMQLSLGTEVQDVNIVRILGRVIAAPCVTRLSGTADFIIRHHVHDLFLFLTETLM